MGEMSARLLLCPALLPVVAASSGCGGGTSRAPTVTFTRGALGVPFVDIKDPAKAFLRAQLRGGAASTLAVFQM